MAATGFTPIQIYYSTTASAVPTAGNLLPGELALNIADMKLYCENGSGVVTLLASASGASGDVVGPASATDNAVVRFDGTTGKLVQNSAVTIADTTGDITGGAYNKVTITAPATSATLTIANGKTLTANSSLTLAGVDAKTLTVNNSLTLAGTDATVMTFPSTSATIARTDAGQTFTGTQVMTSPRIITSVNDTNGNEVFAITATASAVNDFTLVNAATGNNPQIQASGNDTNIGINLVPKGTGTVQANGVEVATISGTQALTNKTINGSNNTITNISLTTAVTGTLPVANGGTGQTSYTDGQLLIGNTATTGLTKATLTAGSNVTITNGNGTITIASTNPGGDVVGPASATDNAIVRFDGTTGKLVQNSGVTIDDDGDVVVSVNSTGDALRITQTGTGNALVVEDSANPDSTPFVVNASGQVGIGTTSPTEMLVVENTTTNARFVLRSDVGTAINHQRSTNDGDTPNYNFIKTRGTIASPLAVQTGDSLGQVLFVGYGGTNNRTLSGIRSVIENYTSDTNISSALVFSNANAGTSPSEVMRITAAGDVGIGTSGPAAKLEAYGTIQARPAATQDAVAIAGRAGGTSSYVATITPTTLTASRTITLPDATGTVALLGTAQTFTAVQTLTDPAIIGTILEDVFTITDGAAFEVDPGNGSIQQITLGASRTPKATNFAAGESLMLMVNDGSAFTITWTDATWGTGGVIWVGATAPTLATTGWTVIEFWKVGTQVYGALVGSVA